MLVHILSMFKVDSLPVHTRHYSVPKALLPCVEWSKDKTTRSMFLGQERKNNLK